MNFITSPPFFPFLGTYFEESAETIFSFWDFHGVGVVLVTWPLNLWRHRPRSGTLSLSELLSILRCASYKKWGDPEMLMEKDGKGSTWPNHNDLIQPPSIVTPKCWWKVRGRVPPQNKKQNIQGLPRWTHQNVVVFLDVWKTTVGGWARYIWDGLSRIMQLCE